MEDVIGALVDLGNAHDEHHAAVVRMADSIDERFKTEERLIAELRDDLHALANRLEALTRATAS